VNFVDAYGNCVICTSCRSKNTKKKQMEEDKENAKLLLEKIGFYKHSNREAWLTASKKKNKA
jgi:hypothetical protein